MGLRINQNIAAMNAYRNLSVTDGQMAKSLEKLSSGFRINRAADDAAGLSISEGLRAQVGGLKVAVRNAQDGISVVQTAEGALNEVHSILQRIRDLAVQASNSGSQDPTAQAAAQLEVTELLDEIDRIGSTTKFGSMNLLDGTFGATASRVSGVVRANDAVTDDGTGDVVGLDVSAGANLISIAANGNAAVDIDVTGEYNNALEYQTAIQAAIDAEADLAGVRVEVKDLGEDLWKVTFSDSDGDQLTLADGTAQAGSLAALTGMTSGQPEATDTGSSGGGGVFQVGANAGEVINVSIEAVNVQQLTLAGVDLDDDPSAAITLIDEAISSISSTRGKLGAFQNRFEHTIANLSVTQENLAASESRIRDVDMAQEMVNFTRSQILTQAGTAMLAQANQAPQSVLQLLR